MATFSYRAIDGDANILSGKTQALNESDLEKKLGSQGLTLIDTVKTSFFDLRREKVSFLQQDLADFSYFLHLIVSSGMSILVGLGDLMENRANRKISYAAGLLLARVNAGMKLSDAMQEHPALFPNYYVQMIAAGEVSGSLEKMLTDLMRYLDWQIAFKKTVRSALAYPVIVLSAVFLLITVLLAFVFPRLITILVGLHVELPIPTRVIIAVSGFVNDNFGYIIIAIATVVFFAKVWLRSYEGRRKFDTLVLAIPFLGDLGRKIDLSRYCKTMATLHSAGLNIIQTLTVSASVARNSVIAEALASVTAAVTNGESIAQSMQKTGVFPSLIISMVTIGEKTGNLDSAFQRISDMLDKEVPDTLRKVLAYLEPLIIVFIGVLVLGVLLSVFLPIYKIVGGIRVR